MTQAIQSESVRQPLRTLLLTKTTEWCNMAERYARAHLGDVQVFSGPTGSSFPTIAREWEGDYMLSFVSPWIVPAETLRRARKASLNFHPGPPEYPGIGCYNFALYDEVSEYGVTFHPMAPAVDSGQIVAVRRFPVLGTDSVETLKDRSMTVMLELFYDIVSRLATGSALQVTDETWRRRPFRRRELNELGRVTPDMPPHEVLRRVRAMRYPGFPGDFVDLGGIRFDASFLARESYPRGGKQLATSARES